MVSMDQRSQGNDVLISFAKLLHLREALTSSDKLLIQKMIFFKGTLKIKRSHRNHGNHGKAALHQVFAGQIIISVFSVVSV
jgi:hypothetical protein